MEKQYRLLVRAQMHGALREPGYVFTLGEGEVGPHRTVVASDHGAQITDHLGSAERLEDIPLYEEVTEPVPPAPEPLVMSSRGEIEALLERFKDRSKWSDDATESEKNLVAGNLNGFVGFVCAEMGWAEAETLPSHTPAPDPSPQGGGEQTVRTVDHR